MLFYSVYVEHYGVPDRNFIQAYSTPAQVMVAEAAYCRERGVPEDELYDTSQYSSVNHMAERVFGEGDEGLKENSEENGDGLYALFVRERKVAYERLQVVKRKRAEKAAEKKTSVTSPVEVAPVVDKGQKQGEKVVEEKVATPLPVEVTLVEDAKMCEEAANPKGIATITLDFVLEGLRHVGVYSLDLPGGAGLVSIADNASEKAVQAIVEHAVFEFSEPACALRDKVLTRECAEGFSAAMENVMQSDNRDYFWEAERTYPFVQWYGGHAEEALEAYVDVLRGVDLSRLYNYYKWGVEPGYKACLSGSVDEEVVMSNKLRKAMSLAMQLLLFRHAPDKGAGHWGVNASLCKLICFTNTVFVWPLVWHMYGCRLYGGGSSRRGKIRSVRDRKILRIWTDDDE